MKLAELKKNKKNFEYDLKKDHKTLDDIISEVEKDYISKTLELCAGNLSISSRVLDISINTLKRKIQEYKINKEVKNDVK